MWYNCTGPECPGGPKHEEFKKQYSYEEEVVFSPALSPDERVDAGDSLAVGMAAGGVAAAGVAVGAAAVLVLFGLTRRTRRQAATVSATARKQGCGVAGSVAPAAQGLESR